MKRLHYLISILLGTAILAGVGYFGHQLLYPYQPWTREAAAPIPVYVHPIVAEINRARQLREAGKAPEAQELLQEQLRLWPEAPEAEPARKLLGEINSDMYFADNSSFGKLEYVVQRGDSLWRIARKLKSTPGMIVRANHLKSDVIQPGDRLIVPDSEFTLTLNLEKERAEVYHAGEFFKQYPLVAIDLPRLRQPEITTCITATAYWQDGQQLTNTSLTAREQATPWLYLGRGGMVLYGLPEEEDEVSTSTDMELTQASHRSGASAMPAEEAHPDVPSRGVALARQDLQELHQFIGRGTPVTIIDAVQTRPELAVAY